LVSAWASDLRLSLGQVAVDDKSNEITAVPRLLELLELAGAVVTLDALHCQKETAAAIRARGADYVLTVKRNQPTLYERLSEWFIEAGNRDYRDVRRHVTVERNRGRTERREYYVAAPPAELRDLLDSGEWADLGAVGMVFRQRETDGRLQEETSFFISSLPPKVKRLAELVRGHWGIENSLHWSLDVTFTEDQSRLRQGAGPEIAAAFRRLALSVLQQDTSLKSSLRGKRLQAGWNNDVLQAILLASAGK
jgi:predicted transposase YbfD/YdcC